MYGNNDNPELIPIQWSSLENNRQIGKGRFADIYLGTWTGVGDRPVVIKHLPAEHYLSIEMRKEFLRESQACMQRQPSEDTPYPIVRLFGISHEPGHFAMIVEYFPQGTLYDLLHTNSSEQLLPDWHVRWQIAMDIANGLAYLQGISVLHQDLNSMNVFLDQNFRAKITNFAFAKLRTFRTAIAGEDKSTIRWQAPETFVSNYQPAESADIYSYGMILFELATRALPFAFISNDMVRDCIIAGFKESPPPNCPQFFARLMEDCWQPEPITRPTLQRIQDRFIDNEQPREEEVRRLEESKFWHFQKSCSRPREKGSYRLWCAGPEDTIKVMREYNRYPVTGFAIKSIEVIDNFRSQQNFENALINLQNHRDIPNFNRNYALINFTSSEIEQLKALISVQSNLRNPLLRTLSEKIQSIDAARIIDYRNVKFSFSEQEALGSFLNRSRRRDLSEKLPFKHWFATSEGKARWRIDRWYKQHSIERPTRETPNIRIMPCWHGTSISASEGICATGYVITEQTGRRFGLGVYSTPQADYAYSTYAALDRPIEDRALIMNWVASYSVFPVLAENENEGDLGDRRYYDARIIPMQPVNPQSVEPSNYNPCSIETINNNRDESDSFNRVQMMTLNKECCLPRYLVRLQPKATPPERYPGKVMYKKGMQHYIHSQYQEAKSCFENAELQGYPPAYLWLCSLYLNKLIKADIPEIWRLKNKAADSIAWFSAQLLTNDADAWLNVGICYYNGIGVIKNITKAIEYFGKAAKKNHPEARFRLGREYEKQQNYQSALTQYSCSAEKGHIEAQFNAAKILEDRCFQRGPSKSRSVMMATEREYSKAIKLYQAAAEANHAQAQNNLGRHYEQINRPSAAYNNYLAAAEQGNIRAKYNLGRCYYDGIGTQRNVDEAFKCFKVAADQGNMEAQFNLGRCYYDAIGTQRNEDEAFKWFKTAAVRGYPEAQYYLGCCYYGGIGTPRNVDEAFNCFKVAADQGNMEAQFNLARCYENLARCHKNEIDISRRELTQAITLYRLSAEQGYEEAQSYLAWWYEKGIGSAPDHQKAIEWYQKLAIRWRHQASTAQNAEEVARLKNKYEVIEKKIARLRSCTIL